MEEEQPGRFQISEAGSADEIRHFFVKRRKVAPSREPPEFSSLITTIRISFLTG